MIDFRDLSSSRPPLRYTLIAKRTLIRVRRSRLVIRRRVESYGVSAFFIALPHLWSCHPPDRRPLGEGIPGIVPGTALRRKSVANLGWEVNRSGGPKCLTFWLRKRPCAATNEQRPNLRTPTPEVPVRKGFLKTSYGWSHRRLPIPPTPSTHAAAPQPDVARRTGRHRAAAQSPALPDTKSLLRQIASLRSHTRILTRRMYALVGVVSDLTNPQMFTLFFQA